MKFVFDKIGRNDIRLLYRGSRDGWDATDFHGKCDDKGATITIIKCSNGRICGGYTSTPWKSSGNY